MEQHQLVAASIAGKHPPAMPSLTAAEREQLSLQVKFLSEILQPSWQRGTELEKALTSMFAVINVFTGDQAKLTLQVAEWCHYLEDIRSTRSGKPRSGQWLAGTSCQALPRSLLT